MHTRLLSVCDAAVGPLPALLSHLPLLTSSHLAPWAVLFVFTVCGTHSYLHVPTHPSPSVLKSSFSPTSLLSLLPTLLPLNPGVLCHLLECSPAGTGRPTKGIHTHLSYLEQPSAALLPSSAHHAASLHLAGLPKPSCHNPRMPCLHLSGSDSICTWADGDKRGFLVASIGATMPVSQVRELMSR